MKAISVRIAKETLRDLNKSLDRLDAHFMTTVEEDNLEFNNEVALIIANSRDQLLKATKHHLVNRYKS